MKVKCIKKIVSICMLCILICTLSVFSVGAVGDSSNRTASIEVVFGSDVSGVELELFEVADYINGEYILNDSFDGSNVNLAELSDSTSAQAAADILEKYARENAFSGKSALISDGGKVRFESILAEKLYLIIPINSGNYTIQSILVSVPYFKDGVPSYDVTVDAKYELNKEFSAVILNKTDNSGNSLSGASFTLQKKDNGVWNDLLTDLASNENGQISVSELPLGDYRFVETKAPDGYLLSSEPYDFTLDSVGTIKEIGGVFEKESGNIAELIVVNYPDDDLSHLRVDKQVSGDNGKTWGQEANIASISGQKAYWKISAEIPDVMEKLGVYTVEDILDKRLIPPNADEVKASIDGVEIPKSSYKVEIKGMDITVDFKVKDLIPYSGKSVNVIFPTAIDVTNPDAIGLRIENVALLTFSKINGLTPDNSDTDNTDTDSQTTTTTTTITTATVEVWTGEIDGYKHDKDNNPLSGAEFTLYSDKSCKTEVAKAASGDDGHFYFKGLLDGTYYLKETKAPNGYQANTNIFEVKIDAKENKEPVKVDVVNVPKPNLPITGGAGIIGISLVGLLISAVGALIVYLAFRFRKREKLAMTI